MKNNHIQTYFKNVGWLSEFIPVRKFHLRIFLVYGHVARSLLSCVQDHVTMFPTNIQHADHVVSYDSTKQCYVA